MDRRTFIGAGAALAAGSLNGRVGAAMPSDPDDMVVLRGALAIHPGLYRYLDKAQVDLGLDKLAGQWDRHSRLKDRYLALSRFLATIRCGHSYANFFNQKEDVASALYGGPTRLPFHFVWLDSAMVVTDGFGSGLPRGAVVTQIDDGEPQDLLGRLKPYVRTDGHNDAKRVSLLEVRGDDTIETFDVFQGLVAPPKDGTFRVRFRAPTGEERLVEIGAIDLAVRRAQMSGPADSGSDIAWQWRMTEGGVAILTMAGWAIWDSKWDWKTWLDDRLNSLGGARGLIVDIRDNEGGANCGDPILSRLITKDYTPPKLEQRLRFRTTDKALDPFLDTWDDSFRTLGRDAQPLSGGFFLRPAGDDALTIPASAKRIDCPVRVLTSPVNSSATFQFAGDFRAIAGGKLVGRATGGNRRGINGGCFFFVRLPQSGIEFDLPLVGYFPTEPQPDAGLLPDVAVSDTYESIATGRDLTMEAALRSIG